MSESGDAASKGGRSNEGLRLLGLIVLIAAISVGAGWVLRSVESEDALRGRVGELEADLERVRGELEAERERSESFESRMEEVGDIAESLMESLGRLQVLAGGELSVADSGSAPDLAEEVDEIDAELAEQAAGPPVDAAEITLEPSALAVPPFADIDEVLDAGSDLGSGQLFLEKAPAAIRDLQPPPEGSPDAGDTGSGAAGGEGPGPGSREHSR